MLKKVLALLLALLTLVCAVIACNEIEDTPANTTAATTNENTTAEITTAATTSATTSATTAVTTAVTTAEPAPIKTVSLSDMTIVHTDDDYSKSAAEYLQSIIKDKTTATVPISNRNGATSPYKILIGNFNLRATNDFFKNDEEYMEKYYQVVFQNNVIVIAAGSRIPAEAACDALVEKTMTKRVKTMSISDDFSFAGDYYGHSEIGFNSRIDEGDIRIVSFNLANYINPQIRINSFFELIELFDADVLVFQEAVGTYNWHDSIDAKLLSEYGYAEVLGNNNNHINNTNPIYYRQSTIELVSHQYLPQSAVFTVAEFKVKASDKLFSCICTHFSTDPNTRITNQREIATFVRNYQSNHNNAPTFLLGDLNSKKDQFDAILTAVMTHAMDMEGIITKNTEYGTTCVVSGVWPGNWLRKDGLLIDHALGAGDGYKGKQFQVVATAKAAATSDHIPVIFDFELT